ncbi:DUF977 family protein [Alkalicoccobacillus murimartini]|uniref:Two-component system CitB family response regulator n=1 Tax=Alkalicoccobacillus murimartini TaxID=171685 RepID=A0ABT9YG30_9BACI|nr:DUF977 family protein [Alkalicoccobacillus murimartini]MDQ0206823.1 two-component system CitB family response regulator [Alkalicoccobacillus murimartini]
MANDAKLIDVLIVEDDVRVAEINRRFVEKVDGFRVIGIATSREETDTLLEMLEPQLVILDIYLPDMNGVEFLPELKATYSHIDVIMISAEKDVGMIVEALRYGVFDYLTKPLIFQRFKDMLSRYKKFRSDITNWSTNKKELNQEAIDRLFNVPAQVDTQSEPYAKGIDQITYQKILEFIQDRGEATTELVVEALGVSRSTARRYLAALVDRGDAQSDVSYGVVGRPEKIYKPT